MRAVLAVYRGRCLGTGSQPGPHPRDEPLLALVGERAIVEGSTRPWGQWCD
jgi:hypothetical protein